MKSYTLHKFFSNQTGLTEMIVAITVLIILLIPMTLLIPAYYQKMNNAQTKSIALDLAQNKIEEFKSRKEVDYNSTPSSFNGDFADYNYTVYKINETVETSETGEIETIIETIKVIVYYKDIEMAEIQGDVVVNPPS